MSQTTNSWIGCFVCITIAVGIITFMISPILGTIVTITLSLTLLLVLILSSEKTKEAAPEPNQFPPSNSESMDLDEDTGFDHSDSVHVRFLDSDILTPDSKTTVTKQKKEAQKKTKTEKLQERIAQLEKQIKILNQQLSEEPSIEPSIETTAPDVTVPTNAELYSEAEELTIVAIKQLLETLDEKFAKRAISEQLYNRLRDKYLARLEKAKRRSESSSNRGTKKDQNR
jgi:hypothetical protein